MTIRKCRRVLCLATVSLALAVLLGTSGCLSVAVFHRLAVAPNKQRLEFKQDSWRKLYTELLTGCFLGTEERQGRKMHHYCFAGVLKGDWRKLHVCIDADGYGQAVAFEDDACALPEVSPAYLVFSCHPNYPQEIDWLADKIQKLSVPGDHPTVLCASRWGNDTICVFRPEDMSETGIGDKTWEGPISVDWKVRSKAMAYVRPLYALPVALLCLPAGAVLTVATVAQMPFCRIEAWAYPNVIETVMGDD
ncbi:MAG: hypothetical protein IKO65_05475 [Victivallales bacterium]|nr:hypothetical protein [Victivallales bacterium]